MQILFIYFFVLLSILQVRLGQVTRFAKAENIKHDKTTLV